MEKGTSVTGVFGEYSVTLCRGVSYIGVELVFWPVLEGAFSCGE